MEGSIWWAVIAGAAAFIGGVVTNPTFIDLLIKVFGTLKCWEIIKSYEQGVVLRWGAGKLQSPGGHPYHRVIGPGLHWLRPISDSVLKTSVVLESSTYAPQVFLSKGGIAYLCQFHATYTVEDILVHMVDVYDTDSVMVDAIAGTLRKIIARMTDEDLLTENLEQKLTERSRSRASKFGLRIERVYISELAPVGLKNGVIRHSGSVGANV